MSGGLRRASPVGLAWLLLAADPAHAHSFGKLYNLPVPFWMYAWGAAGALLLSFLVVGWFVTQQSVQLDLRSRPLGLAMTRWLNRGLTLLKGLALPCLLLCLATGLFGTRNPYRNFSMTFFWIVFVLGYAYFTALAGDSYARINPWQQCCNAARRLRVTAFRGWWPYPAAWGCWPALGFYMAFIWLELFAHIQPFSLALALALYGLLTLLGCAIFGAEDWLRQGEFFGVFLRLLAKMAPLEIMPAAPDGQTAVWRLRAPFSGLLQEAPQQFSELLFVLFMLSSTAFDGLRETEPWMRWFWVDFHAWAAPWVGQNIVQAYPVLLKLFLAWNTVVLLLSPFLYCGVYLVFVALARRIAGSPLPLRDLALRFGYSLLPIALVYNITHYYTLIITQGTQMVRLVSDPFGWGWDLFGTALWLRAPLLPDMGVVWHTQVWLILFGHIVSVYLAHLEALRVFPTRRAATLSQLPMLVLMMLFTTVGLWILAQPIKGGM